MTNKKELSWILEEDKNQDLRVVSIVISKKLQVWCIIEQKEFHFTDVEFQKLASWYIL